MTDRKAPAGWYDDPAGSGGRRYWDGSAWTNRVEAGERSRSQRSVADRLPDGYMMLNGVRVPLGSKDVPAPASTSRSGRTRTRLVVLGLIALLAFLWLFSLIGEPTDDSGGATVEVSWHGD